MPRTKKPLNVNAERKRSRKWIKIMQIEINRRIFLSAWIEHSKIDLLMWERERKSYYSWDGWELAEIEKISDKIEFSPLFSEREIFYLSTNQSSNFLANPKSWNSIDRKTIDWCHRQLTWSKLNFAEQRWFNWDLSTRRTSLSLHIHQTISHDSALHTMCWHRRNISKQIAFSWTTANSSQYVCI